MGGGLGSDMLRMNYSAIHNGGGNGIGTSESISTMIGLGGMGTMGINGGGKDNPGDSPLPHSIRVVSCFNASPLIEMWYARFVLS